MSWEEKIRKVEPYVAGEQPKEKNIIKLNTNECPYPPAPGVEEAVRKLKEMKTDDLMVVRFDMRFSGAYWALAG